MPTDDDELDQIVIDNPDAVVVHSESADDGSYECNFCELKCSGDDLWIYECRNCGDDIASCADCAHWEYCVGCQIFTLGCMGLLAGI